MTSVPKLRKMELNSTPTAPAPMTISDLGGCVEGEDFDVGEDAVVGLLAEEHARLRSGGEDDVLRLDCRFRAVGAGQVDGVDAVFGRPVSLP